MAEEKRKYRTYDKDFKIKAAKLVVEQEMTQAQVARDLGVNQGLIGKWVKQYESSKPHAFPGRGKMQPLEEENKRLQRELKRAQMEVEILRKATAYFAQTQR
jgi:transposase